MARTPMQTEKAWSKFHAAFLKHIPDIKKDFTNLLSLLSRFLELNIPEVSLLLQQQSSGPEPPNAALTPVSDREKDMLLYIGGCNDNRL